MGTCQRAIGHRCSHRDPDAALDALRVPGGRHTSKDRLPTVSLSIEIGAMTLWGRGRRMIKFLMKFNYSNASWARMLAGTDDPSPAVAALLEHLGGKLESMHWEVEDAAAYVVGYLPDSLSAAAAIVAATR